jgi:phosphoribosylformylglycinamidine (FGAM) synthase-like enzyme
VTLAEACVSGPHRLGAEVDLGPARGVADPTLFGEGPSRVLVSVKVDRAQHFEQLMREFRVAWRFIGRVGGDRLRIRTDERSLVDLDLDRISGAWRGGFERHVG